MASSHVGFTASCIFRDINQSNQFRESQNDNIFCTNNKYYVKQFVLDENSCDDINSIGLKSCVHSKRNKIDDIQNEKFDEMKSLDQCGAKPVEKGHSRSPKASSLVQIWEERLRRWNGMNENDPSRGNSGSSSVENAEETPRISFSGECDLLSEWSFRSRNSDAGESERVRVADIVKKLSNVDGENESFGGVFDQVFCLPRIRGRQAFNELLMQMERDRKRELDALVDRHAVSKFKHHKRIQSLLKLRILQKQMAAEGPESPKKLNSPDVKRSSLGSNIMQLRAKFSMGFGRCMTFNGKEVGSRRSNIEIQKSNQHKNESSFSSQLSKDKHQPEVHCDEQQKLSSVQHSMLQSGEDSQKKAHQIADVMHGTRIEASNADPNEFGDGPIFSQPGPEFSVNFCSQANENSHPQECHTSDHDDRSLLQHHSISHAEGDIHEEANLSSIIPQVQRLEACNYDSQGLRQEQSWDCSNIYVEGPAGELMFLNDWDENEISYEEEINEGLTETNYDWISDIARPRSYWEDCRNSRYQEVLMRESNNEIRQLLERGAVSSFLSSEFRDRIDQLMISRVQGKNPASIHEKKDREEELQQSMLSLNRDMHSLTNIDEAIDVEQELVAIEVESEKSLATQNHHVNGEEGQQKVNPRSPQKQEDLEVVIGIDLIDQNHRVNDSNDHPISSLKIPSQSRLESRYYQDQKTVNSFYQATSTTSNPRLQSEPYDQERHHSNSMCHSSIDAELINDLSGKLEQIKQEMLELRKSVMFCMDMQFEMQHLFKQGAHSDGKNIQHKRPRKDCCCICYRKQVDSLLYRCGHMCTCLECAHELQYSSGKCPICRASIDDVVRPYSESTC